MERLERDIPQILCKLERIFPPGLFDSIEHLPVHLPYEARIAGPIQYRWMYPFERYLGTLKRMIGNKASVEGSICEAYLMKSQHNYFHIILNLMPCHVIIMWIITMMVVL